MIIKITGVYNNEIYCEIIQDGKITYAYGFDNIKKAVDEAGKRNEKVELKGKKTLDDCIRLNNLMEVK